MRKIKIAHLGLGHMHSRQKLDCIMDRPEIFEPVCIVAPDDDNLDTPCAAESLAMYPQIPRWSLQQMLNADVDAVLIETDDRLLIKYAQICIEADKHIHLDKPAGEDITAFRQLLSVAKKRLLIVQMAYMYRYNPAVQEALRLVREGILGDILRIDAIMNTEHPYWIRDWLQQFQGGTMHTFGCHMIDLVLLFQGVPDQVFPILKQSGLDGCSVNDNNIALLVYPKGASVVQASSIEVNGFGRRQLVIIGTEGTIELKPLESNHFEYMTPMSISYKSLTKAALYADMHESFRIKPMLNRHDDMLLDFASMVRGEKENPFSLEYEALLQNVSLAACGFDIDIKEKIEI